MFYKKYKEAIIITAFSFILSFIAVYHWFSDNSIIYYWDSFVLLDAQRTWEYLYYAWSNSIFSGSATLGGWSLIPYWSLFQMVHLLSGSVSFAEGILYGGLMFASLVSFYLLLSHLTKLIIGNEINSPLLKVGNYIFSILYTFNLYTFYYAYFMLNPDMFILAFLPLNVYALLKIYPLNSVKYSIEKKWIFIFFTTALLMTAGFATYVFLAQYLIWVLLYLFLHFLASKTKIFSFKTISLLVFVFLIILSQWWWFYPALLTFENRYDVEAQIGTTVWFDAGLIESRLLNTIRLLGVTLALSNEFIWSKFYSDKWFTFPLFIPPLIIIFLLSKFNQLKHKIIIVFLLVIFLFSLFIVKFNNPPFAFITAFAFHNIPFFGAFRGAYHKAGMYYAFTYFILSGVGFYYIIRYFLQQKKQIRLFLSFLTIIVVGIIITGPFFLFYKDNITKLSFTFDNKDYTFKSKTRVPPEYHELKSFFSSKCPGKPTVIVPRGGWISSANWPKYDNSYAGIDFIPQIIRCEFMTTVVFIPKPEVSNQGLFFLLDHGDYKGFKNFLTQGQIGYILVRKDHIPYSPTSWVYVDPKKVSSALEKDSDFKRIFENDLLTLYEFNPLKEIKNYGFALPGDVVHTNSSLTTYVNYSLLAKHFPTSIGKVIINTKKEFNRFKSYVTSHVLESSCISCNEKKPNIVVKKAERKLSVQEEGLYSCQVTAFDNETKIDGIKVTDSNGNTTVLSSPAENYFQKGDYAVAIDYAVKHVFDKPQAELKSGELVKVPLGKISQGEYRLTYKVENKDFSVEGFLTKNELSAQALKIRPYGREGDGVLFTDPSPASATAREVERIFTANEFTNDSYTLYFNAEKIKTSSGIPAKITDVTINKVVKEELITFSCGKGNSVGSDSDTKSIKVTQVNPTLYKVVLPESFKKGFLTSNKSYDGHWIAYSSAGGKKRIFDHLQSGYANAWFIDTGEDKTVTIEYVQQNKMIKNGVITGIVFLISFLLYLKIVNANNKNTLAKKKSGRRR